MSTSDKQPKSTEKETKEVTQMTQENKTEASASKQELSREEKKALRRAGILNQSALDIPEAEKEKGYRYRTCNVLPGNIEKYKSMGYEVDPNTREIEVGGATGSMKAVRMRITEDNAQILDEIRDDLAREQYEMITKSPIPAEAQNPYDKVTKENLK